METETEMETRLALQLTERFAAMREPRAYEVGLLDVGRNLKGFDFPAEVLREALSLFDGVTSFADHTPLDQHPTVRKVLGVVVAPRQDESGNAWGVLRLADNTFADLLDFVCTERGAGRAVPRVGMSADLSFQFDEQKRATKIVRVHSIDLVFDPAAGGEIRRILNSVQGGLPMTDELTAVKPTAVNPIEPAEIAQQKAAQQLLRMQCSAVLQGVLNVSDLPEPFKAVVREQFRDKVFDASELDASMERQRKLWAQLNEANVVQGVGAKPEKPKSAGLVMWSDLDRLQFAVDQLLGAPVPEAHSDVPRLRGIQELYLLLSGDREMRGVFHADRIQFANANTTTMAALVANAMNKVIPNQWAVLGQQGYNWWEQVFLQDDMGNLHDIRWNTVGGFGDLPTVAEGAAYTELVWDDKVETTSFVKKGGFVGLTLEMMDKDETRKVKQIPIALATSGLRTLSAACASLWTAHSAVGDHLADGADWFHSTLAIRGGDGGTAASGNLGTTALSAAEWLVRSANIYKQAEFNSTKRLGLRPRYCLIPIDLEKTARDIFLNDWDVTDNKHADNLLKNSAIPLVVPEWTDKTDWAACTDPAVHPTVGVGFRYGRKPEVFVAGDDLVGSMFTNDEMRIKSRFFFAVGVIDWRGTSKSNCA